MVRSVRHDPAGRDPQASRPRRITARLLTAAAEVAASCRAAALFVSADALDGRRLDFPDDLPTRVVYLGANRAVEELRARGTPEDAIIRIPDVPMTRMGQIKIALLLGLTRGIVHREDLVICLSGLSGSGTLDTLMVVDVPVEFEHFLAPSGGELLPPDVHPEVAERVVTIATELGSDGREGKPLGTMFVVGDARRVLRLSRRLILNPFQGYPEDERNLQDPHLEETVKELSSLDGAFVIRGDGIVEACGVYLEGAPDEPIELPRGLGARHHAAAAITAVTDSVAVTVSESTGTVTIFRSGRILTTLKRPRRLDAQRAVDRPLE